VHFVPAARTEVIDRTAEGFSLRAASAASGVPLSTIQQWLARGKREDRGEYHAFAQAMTAARSAARDARRQPSSPSPPPPASAPSDAGAEPMGPDELAVVISTAARRGSVTAMKLRLEQLRAEAPPEPEPEPSESAIARLARTARPWSDQTGNGGLVDCDADTAFAELADLAAHRHNGPDDAA
jgi:hypothetical protein